MGYETSLEFVEIELKQTSFASFCNYVAKHRNSTSSFHYMLEYLCLDTNEYGYLDWNLDKDSKQRLAAKCGEPPAATNSIDWRSVKDVFLELGVDEYDRIGKWYSMDRFIPWLSGYCQSGRIIQVSQEGDGLVWGWEFNNKGQYRELDLQPCGLWRTPKMRLMFPKARNIQDPANHQVLSGIRSLNHKGGNRYLILEDRSRSNAFMQTFKKSPKLFLVEYAEGKPQRQFSSPTITQHAVEKLFLAYLRRDKSFKSITEWREIRNEVLKKSKR